MEAGLEVLTIGYQGRNVAELTRLLQQHRVDVVLDIREFAWSRKPGFSRAQLAPALHRAGLEYVHEPRLGSPKRLRDVYKATGDWSTFAAAYTTHLQALLELIRDYLRQLADQRVCLLCFEEQAGLCHRSLVAEAFARSGAGTPRHI